MLFVLSVWMERTSTQCKYLFFFTAQGSSPHLLSLSSEGEWYLHYFCYGNCSTPTIWCECSAVCYFSESEKGTSASQWWKRKGTKKTEGKENTWSERLGVKFILFYSLQPGPFGCGWHPVGQTQLLELGVEKGLEPQTSFGLVGATGVVLQAVGEHQLHILNVLHCQGIKGNFPSQSIHVTMWH